MEQQQEGPLYKPGSDAEKAFIAELCLKSGLDLRPLPSRKIETGWETWLRALYPNTFAAPFAQHHKNFWEHTWSIKQGVRPRPFIFVLARGGGKSTSTEVLGPMLGALRKRHYGLYISSTQDQANKHVADVEGKLTTKTYRKFYPDMASPRLTEMRHAKGWRQNRLWTKAGWVMDALGLDTAARGAKAEDNRPDFIIGDDLDMAHQSMVVIQKNMETLRKGILPTGSNDLAVFFVQNVIHRDSIFAQLVDGRAGFLTDAIIEGPHPAVHNFKYERKGRETIVLSGTPTWQGQNLVTVQEQVNTWGIAAFLTEAQHETDVVAEGAVFPQFDERYSVITWSEFARVYGDIARGERDGRIVPRPPARWLKGQAQDWGSTVAHPCGTVWVMRPSEADDYPDTVFVYRELVIPEYPYPETPTDQISPGYISKLMYDAESVWGEKMSMALFSHEQTAALNTYWRDLPSIYKRRFTKWRPDRRAGIAPMQNYFQVIDNDRPNPFRSELYGRSRLILIVADGQGELVWNSARNRWDVETAVDVMGLKRLRDELKEYHYPQNAVGTEKELPYKDFDDLLDPLKALADVFFPGRAPLNEQEKIDALMPDSLKSAVVAAIEDPAKRQAAEFCAYTASHAARRRLNESQPQQRKSLRGMRRAEPINPSFGRN